ncbi:hypothetical protein IJT10_00660 [bacterium]|nr:hypothetical protein [bacterium]
MTDNNNKHKEEASSDLLLKRKVKDTVFSDLFRNPHYLRLLYLVLHPEDTSVTEEDLQDVTINNVITDAQYNDLGFRVRDRLIILVEAQSTWSPNIAIRLWFYLAETYDRYVQKHNLNLYSSKKCKLPIPELYVIYTGKERKVPKYISLKKDFFNAKGSIDAQIEVINCSNEGDIIDQYIRFCQVCTREVKTNGFNEQTVCRIVSICQLQDVLKDYLENRRVELMNMIAYLHDQDQVFKMQIDEARQEAKQEAMKEARQEAMKEALNNEISSIIETCKSFGKSVSETVDYITSKYKLTPKEAESRVNKCWNNKD